MPVLKHIVAVAGLVTDARERVLMIRSPRRDWEFPGGQVEGGESLTDALRRKVPAIRDRMRDMLEFSGQVVYRAYTFDAGEVYADYTVHEERRI
jgi:hypothetical protein